MVKDKMVLGTVSQRLAGIVLPESVIIQPL
jgi:hypothetical protein